MADGWAHGAVLELEAQGIAAGSLWQWLVSWALATPREPKAEPAGAAQDRARSLGGHRGQQWRDPSSEDTGGEPSSRTFYFTRNETGAWTSPGLKKPHSLGGHLGPNLAVVQPRQGLRKQRGFPAAPRPALAAVTASPNGRGRGEIAPQAERPRAWQGTGRSCVESSPNSSRAAWRPSAVGLSPPHWPALSWAARPPGNPRPSMHRLPQQLEQATLLRFPGIQPLRGPVSVTARCPARMGLEAPAPAFSLAGSLCPGRPEGQSRAGRRAQGLPGAPGSRIEILRPAPSAWAQHLAFRTRMQVLQQQQAVGGGQKP